MRRALLLSLLAGTLGAGESSRKASKGKVKDTFWNYTLAFAGLEPLLTLGGSELLAHAKAPEGVRVELTVFEDAAEASGAQWCSEERTRLEKAGRKLLDVSVDGHRLFFREKKYGAFDAEHGYAYVVRGPQCFVLHAWIPDRTAESKKVIRRLLSALKLGTNEGCGLRVLDAARRMGKEPLDKKALLAGGVDYLKQTPRGAAMPGLAALVFLRAEKVKGELGPLERYALRYHGGRALHLAGKPELAVAWLEKAEAGSDGERRSFAAWELARALAVLDRKDDAFKALNRAFDNGQQPAGEIELSKDTALRNLREDPRWETFWRRKVRGR
ncbi:MAG: hypothetical protein OER88_10640 [Planctomycetota bacterium]|nr:hypothetical protein [Planctomycetota bacterium]